MYVCGGREEKRKVWGYMSGGEKEKEIKNKWGVEFTCMVGKKRGSGKEIRKKNLKGKKLN
jgi:hypothetical protein